MQLRRWQSSRGCPLTSRSWRHWWRRLSSNDRYQLMTMTLDYSRTGVTLQRHYDALSSACHHSVLLLLLLLMMMMMMTPCDVVGWWWVYDCCQWQRAAAVSTCNTHQWHQVINTSFRPRQTARTSKVKCQLILFLHLWLLYARSPVISHEKCHKILEFLSKITKRSWLEWLSEQQAKLDVHCD